MPADTYKLTSHHAYIYTALYLPKATSYASHSTQESGGGGGGLALEVGSSCGQTENPVLTTVNSTGCPWVLESNTNSALAQIRCCRLHLSDVLHTYTSKIPPPPPAHFWPLPKWCVTHLHLLKNTPALTHFWPIPKWCVTHLYFPQKTSPLAHF